MVGGGSESMKDMNADVNDVFLLLVGRVIKRQIDH
jgi:hypothetical protein